MDGSAASAERAQACTVREAFIDADGARRERRSRWLSCEEDQDDGRFHVVYHLAHGRRLRTFLDSGKPGRWSASPARSRFQLPMDPSNIRACRPESAGAARCRLLSRLWHSLGMLGEEPSKAWAAASLSARRRHVAMSRGLLVFCRRGAWPASIAASCIRFGNGSNRR